MTFGRRRGTAVLAGAVVLAVLFVGCSSDDDQAGDDTTTPAEAPESTDVQAPSTSEAPETSSSSSSSSSSAPPVVAAPDCDNPAPADAATESSGSGDVDGDGDDDLLEVSRTGGGDWYVEIEFGAGGQTNLQITDVDEATGAEMIGGADVQGDGIDELFVRVGSGAATAIVGLFTVDACEVVPITFGGSPARFPVGATAGSTSGLQCAGEPAAGTIFLYAGSSADGESYDISWQELAVVGTELSSAGDGNGSASYGDELHTAASTFHCGSLTFG